MSKTVPVPVSCPIVVAVVGAVEVGGALDLSLDAPAQTVEGVDGYIGADANDSRA